MQQHGIYYFNALFDLELGDAPTEKVRQGAAEMGPLFGFCGTSKDRILLDVKVPDAYWSYLERAAIPHALCWRDTDNPKNYEGIAWGWNRQSVDRLTSLGVKIRHPDLDVVKKINCRKFCAVFNARTHTGVPGTRFCSSINEFHQVVHELNNQFPLVAKPAFGGSGMGFVMIDNPQKIDPSAALMVSHEGCTIEPWCSRIHDISSSCTIDVAGNVSGLVHYRCHANGRGMFYGVTLGPAQDAVIEKYRDDLETAAMLAAQTLAAAGYFGGVSFDSFVYRDAVSGDEKLAAVIEINGRHIMSTIARALHASIGVDRYCLFRFISRKACTLPESYEELHKLLGPDRYDPLLRKGILSLSPLRVYQNDSPVQPVRSAFLFAGETREETSRMENHLLMRFTSKK